MQSRSRPLSCGRQHRECPDETGTEELIPLLRGFDEESRVTTVPATAGLRSFPSSSGDKTTPP
jgi:hypothetical protein